MKVKDSDIILDDIEVKPRTIQLNAEVDGILRRKEVLLQYRSGYIFVQTSQPIYTPRERGNPRQAVYWIKRGLLKIIELKEDCLKFQYLYL